MTTNGTEHKVPESVRKEIELLVVDENISYKQIAEQYEVSDVYVSRIAREMGIHRSPRTSRNREERSRHSLDEQIEQAKQQLEELIRRKKAMEIGFAWDGEHGTTVIVNGVDAHFIELGGLGKFRDFIIESINRRKLSNKI